MNLKSSMYTWTGAIKWKINILHLFQSESGENDTLNNLGNACTHKNHNKSRENLNIYTLVSIYLKIRTHSRYQTKNCNIIIGGGGGGARGRAGVREEKKNHHAAKTSPCNQNLVYYKHMSVFMVFASKQVNINKNYFLMYYSPCVDNRNQVSSLHAHNFSYTVSKRRTN